MTQWKKTFRRETPKTKAELREMLTEAVRNTQPERERLPKAERLLGGIASIYRGPMVVIGTGAALLAIILANKEIPIPYLYSIWLAPTVLQGSMDPTNSWTLWTIGHTKVSHGQFLKTALPFGCLMVAVNSLICYLMLGSLQ